MTTIAYGTDLWLGELERKGESPRTITTYRRLLDKLADAYPHIDVDELTATQLRRFLDSQGRKQDGSRKADATLAQNVSIVNNFMDWLTREGTIVRNPTRRNGDRILMRPRLAPAEENDNVVTITGADVAKLLEAADASGAWNKRLAVNGLVYLGPRREALAQARRSDYDADARTLAFDEKGRKRIRKPVPDRFADLLDAAIADGVYETDDDYLIPGNGVQRRKGPRDARVIWRLVRSVAADAGVTTHVHALRAAFAVHFLERKPGEIVALKDLMGHRRLETTLVYLRRRDRQRSMETVRDLDWTTQGSAGARLAVGAPAPDEETPDEVDRSVRDLPPLTSIRSPQFAAKPMEANPVAEKEGFEPSFDAEPEPERLGAHHDQPAPLDETLLGLARDAGGNRTRVSVPSESPLEQGEDESDLAGGTR